MLARTMSSSLFGTTSERHSHSSSVQGEMTSTFSAAVTKRRELISVEIGSISSSCASTQSSSSPLRGERIEVRGVTSRQKVRDFFLLPRSFHQRIPNLKAYTFLFLPHFVIP